MVVNMISKSFEMFMERCVSVIDEKDPKRKEEIINTLKILYFGGVHFMFYANKRITADRLGKEMVDRLLQDIEGELAEFLHANGILYKRAGVTFH